MSGDFLKDTHGFDLDALLPQPLPHLPPPTKMATFTKIDDGEQPVITVNSAHKISKIEDNTYGGFTE